MLWLINNNDSCKCWRSWCLLLLWLWKHRRRQHVEAVECFCHCEFRVSGNAYECVLACVF